MGIVLIVRYYLIELTKVNIYSGFKNFHHPYQTIFHYPLGHICDTKENSVTKEILNWQR